jgi:cytosine/uracil/thiamine/allantoin permease
MNYASFVKRENRTLIEKDGQHKGQKKNNDLQNTTKETKDWAKRDMTSDVVELSRWRMKSTRFESPYLHM